MPPLTRIFTVSNVSSGPHVEECFCRAVLSHRLAKRVEAATFFGPVFSQTLAWGLVRFIQLSAEVDSELLDREAFVQLVRAPWAFLLRSTHLLDARVALDW